MKTEINNKEETLEFISEVNEVYSRLEEQDDSNVFVMVCGSRGNDKELDWGINELIAKAHYIDHCNTSIDIIDADELSNFSKLLGMKAGDKVMRVIIKEKDYEDAEFYLDPTNLKKISETQKKIDNQNLNYTKTIINSQLQVIFYNNNGKFAFALGEVEDWNLAVKFIDNMDINKIEIIYPDDIYTYYEEDELYDNTCEVREKEPALAVYYK